MRTVMFLDCSAYPDGHGIVRCAGAAEVEDRYRLTSRGGPLAGVQIRCPSGHSFHGAEEVPALAKRPDAA